MENSSALMARAARNAKRRALVEAAEEQRAPLIVGLLLSYSHLWLVLDYSFL